MIAERFNPAAAAVAGLTLTMGLTLFVVGTGPVRGLGGDVGIVLFGVACMAAVDLGTARVRVLGMVCLAFAVEGFQGLGLVGANAHWLLHLTLGSTFDPLDLLAYCLGAVLAAVAERAWSSATPR